MKKIVFYISLTIIIYLIYIIANIFLYHYTKLNNYGSGFLIGKIVLLIIFVILALKMNPFKNKNINRN